MAIMIVKIVHRTESWTERKKNDTMNMPNVHKKGGAIFLIKLHIGYFKTTPITNNWLMTNTSRSRDLDTYSIPYPCGAAIHKTPIMMIRLKVATENDKKVFPTALYNPLA